MGATPGNVGAASDSGAWHPFLECAALAKVDLLVAGDKDLLILGVYKGTVCR